MRFLYTAGDKNNLVSLERDFPEAGEVPCGLFCRGPQRGCLGPACSLWPGGACCRSGRVWG